MKALALLFLVGVVAAAEPEPTYLYVAYPLSVEPIKPFYVAHVDTMRKCMDMAKRLNEEHAKFLKELGDGAEYVCLRAERVTT